MPARILVVCTANVCRSPATAALLARGLPGVQVVSRGVEAQNGRPACAATARAVGKLGISLQQHRSALLTADDVRASTLVLTATRWHRASVLDLWPPASVRTHTLAAAARGADWLSLRDLGPTARDPSERVLALAATLHEYGSALPPAVPVDADDLSDPHAGSRHPVTVSRLAALAEQLLAGIADPSASGIRLIDSQNAYSGSSVER
jgi:protein-tyrosine phosphatase